MAHDISFAELFFIIITSYLMLVACLCVEDWLLNLGNMTFMDNMQARVMTLVSFKSSTESEIASLGITIC